MPARADIDPIEFAPHWSNTILADVIENGSDLRSRVVGGKAMDLLGGGAAGHRSSKHPCRPLAELLNDSARKMAAERKPVFCLMWFSFLVEPEVTVELLFLPLSADGELVDMVLGVVTSNTENWTVQPTIGELFAKAEEVSNTTALL